MKQSKVAHEVMKVTQADSESARNRGDELTEDAQFMDAAYWYGYAAGLKHIHQYLFAVGDED